MSREANTSAARENSLIEVGHSFFKNGVKGFSRGRYIRYADLPTFIQECNRFSVFRTAYLYDKPDADHANLYGDFYLDLDDLEDFEKVREDTITVLKYLSLCYKIEERYVKIYFSGHKGLHLIIPASILGVEPSPILNGVFKFIASSIKTYTRNKTIDTQIYDNKRLFRVPNTLHEKSGLFKIPLTLDEVKTLSHEQIKELAMRPRYVPFAKCHTKVFYAEQQFQRSIQSFALTDEYSKKDRRFTSTLNTTPPCIQSILDNGAEEGQRNITIACLSSFCRSIGKSLKESIAYISDWNNNNINPTPQYELERTVRSIFLSGKTYGCSTLKTITECNVGLCTLKKGKGDIRGSPTRR